MEILSNFTFVGIFLFVVIFASTLILLEVGRRIGVRKRALAPEGQESGLGAVEGAVFGLMGLLLAFTFSGAASRFEVRRQLIVQETNAIGTAYLRLDLLPAGDQPKLREDFRAYVRCAAVSLSEAARPGSVQGRDVKSDFPAGPNLVASRCGMQRNEFSSRDFSGAVIAE